MQINEAGIEEIWNWRRNVDTGQRIFARKRADALRYLRTHENYDEEMLLREALQRYNGGRYHTWDTTAKKWIATPPNAYVDTVWEYLTSKPW